MELDLLSLRKMMKAEFRIEIGTLIVSSVNDRIRQGFSPRALCLGVGGGALLGFLNSKLGFEIVGALRSLVYSHGVIVINVIPPNVFFSKILVKQLQDVFHKFYAMDAKNDGNIVLIATVSPIVSNDHDSGSCVRVCFYRVASYNTSPLGLDRLQLC
ncbi:hypothetical protein Hanom_Chr12g01148001 [Helianthus anomalus]